MTEGYSYRKYAWKRFKKNKPALVSLWILLVLVLVAIFSPFLANNQPLYVKYHGESFYPAWETFWDETAVDSVELSSGEIKVFEYQLIDWRSEPVESAVWPIIPYAPGIADKYNRDYTHPNYEQRLMNANGEIVEMPGHLRHYLGTDKLGRDVASGLVHGTKISLLVGVISMGIALIIGIVLGALAGYFGDYDYQLTRLQFWLSCLGVFLGFFYGIYNRSFEINEAFSQSTIAGAGSLLYGLGLWVVIVLLFGAAGKKLSKGDFWCKSVNVPLDSLVNRLIEVLNSIPTLILIISISAILAEKSLYTLMVIIGLTSWTGIARLMRAEVLRIKQMEFIQAGKVMGYSNSRLILKHVIPNGLGPIFVSFAFGVASAILVESGLSFLGIGVPDDVITWGSMLSLGREEFEAWWLVLYPGFAIFITITIANLIGEGLRDALDPKHQQ